MQNFDRGAQNWSIKSEFAENGYVGTLSIRNQLKYPRHQNLCSLMQTCLSNDLYMLIEHELNAY